MMESSNQPTAILPTINSSSRRKQSKPNRLEHIVVDSPATTIDPIVPSLTQYHVAAEQQQESAFHDDDSDRISLNCEDGSLSSHSPDEQFAMEDLLNQSRTSNEKSQVDQEQMLIDTNESTTKTSNVAILDFSLKLDETNKNLLNATNRTRALNPNGKSRSFKRKHQNGNLDGKNAPNFNATNRIFHADAFCSICRKEFCNKYFLKTHLANKHGIFDQQSLVSSPSLIAFTGGNDLNSSDSNLQHSYTMVSTLLQNGRDEYSASSPSDLIENHRMEDEDENENENELSSLKDQMNGVVAGDDDQQADSNGHSNLNGDNVDDDNDDDDDDDDDEQDGTNSNSLIHLPQQIASILRNENSKRTSMSINNDEDEDDDQQQETVTNSPSNSLDYQQNQQQASTSSASATAMISATTNLSRHSSVKLAEDFCDICQKHFCNKYYLRKHKLDVHGVQTDCNIKPYKRIDNNSLSSKNSSASTSTQQISSSIQLPSTFPNVTFNPSTVQQSLGMLLNPIFSPLVQSQTSSDSPTSFSSNKRRYTENSNESSSSSSIAPTTLNKSQFPPSLLSVASDVAHVIANQFASVATNSTSSSTSAIVPSTTTTSNISVAQGKSQISTCHLCGKKFQSNEYLQLHLMNKHQISADLQTLESLEQQRIKSTNFIKSSNGSLNNTVKKIKLETNETPSTTILKSSASSSPADPSAIPGIVDTYFAAKMADRVSCNICHKQVCNKYFLKTHKLKVHGIGPESTVTSSSSSSLNTSNNGEINDETNENQAQSRSSFDGSPPQLVVDEMNLVTNEPGVIPSPDALTASVNTFIGTSNHPTSNSSNDSTETQPKTTFCEICSQSFPTKFLHVHLNNAHGIQQTANHLNGTTTTTIKRLSISNGNSTAANPVRLKQTPQVQLRVTCQVCKKELCNKYFLRAHMRNVHNISVDDLRLLQPQTPTNNSTTTNTSQLSPPSDSPSSKQTFSLSSNLLSSTSTNPTDSNQTSNNTLQLSSFNDNESNHFNGHTTDSNESENFHLSKHLNAYSTTFKSATNDNNNNNNRVLSMQPFLVESDDDLYKDLFVPCMVYLPCRHRVTKPLEISLRLKPVDNNNSTNASTATTTIAE